VVQGDGDGSCHDRPPIAECDNHRERGKKVHMDVHLPQMALHGTEDARDGQHHRDGQEQALCGAAAPECHQAGEGGDCSHDGAKPADGTSNQPFQRHDERQVGHDVETHEARSTDAQYLNRVHR
jgi:hypothetical protein